MDGGGCRFPDTPFVIGENENARHCHFLFSLNKPIENRCAGKDFVEVCYTGLRESCWREQRAFKVVGRGSISPQLPQSQS